MVPNLRFPGFDGEWEEKRLESLGEYQGGGTPDTTKQEFWNGNIPWISSSDILENSIHEIKKEKFITQRAIEESATKLIPKGSILMVSRVGIGKFAVANESLCTSQDFTNLKANDNSYFLAYYFKAKSHRFVSLSQGTSIKGFTTKDIKNAKFLIPIKDEQNKIANLLTIVDHRIQTQNKIIKNLKSLIKGMMQKIFSQELRFKDSDGNYFVSWEEKKLGEILKIGSGKDYKHLEEGDIPVYGTGGYMTSVNDYIYEGKSVGIGRKGTIDKPVFLNGKFWTVDTLFYTHSFSGVLPYFVFLLFQRINWLKYNEASGVPSLSKTTIEKIKVKVPSIPEQRKIINFLLSLDQKLEKEKQILAQYQQQKKYLIQNLFV